jgi:hypothetical protein
VTANLISTNLGSATPTNPPLPLPNPPEQSCRVWCKLLDVLDHHFDPIWSALVSVVSFVFAWISKKFATRKKSPAITTENESAAIEEEKSPVWNTIFIICCGAFIVSLLLAVISLFAEGHRVSPAQPQANSDHFIQMLVSDESKILSAKLDNQNARLDDLKITLSNQETEIRTIKSITETGQTFHWWEILPNCVTAIAVIIGGLWAYRRWNYERPSDEPSIDGDLSVESSILEGNKIAVSIRAVWNNRSRFPLKLEKSSVLVYEIDPELPERILDAKKPGEAILPEFITEISDLEPKSESVLRAHFVLKRGPVYFFHWELISKRGDHWKKHIIWDSNFRSP